MERVFTELHDAYANSASGQKGCMICLIGIKNGVKHVFTANSWRLERIEESIITANVCIGGIYNEYK